MDSWHFAGSSALIFFPQKPDSLFLLHEPCPMIRPSLGSCQRVVVMAYVSRC